MAELLINLKQVRGQKRTSYNYKVTVQDTTRKIVPGKELSLQPSQITNQTAITFTAFEGERKVGSTTSHIEELLSARWLKLSGGLEISVVCKIGQKKKARLNSPSKKRLTSGDKKCPFLEKLAKGIEADDSVYAEIKSQRIGDPLLNQHIHITFEPDSPSRSTIPVDIPDLDQVTPSNVLKYDSRTLKRLILAFSDKIQLYSSRAKMLPQYRQELYNKTQDRYELQQSLMAETDQLKDQGEAHIETLNQSNQERNNSITGLFDRKRQAIELAHEIDTLQAKIGAFERENLILRTQQIRLSDTRNMVNESQHLKEGFDLKASGMVNEMNSARDTIKTKVSKLEKEKVELEEQIQSCQSQIKTFTGENETLRDQISKMKFGMLRDAFLVNKISEAVQHADIHHGSRQTAHENLEQLAYEVNEKARIVQEQHSGLLAQKKDLSRQVTDLSKALAEKEDKLLDLKIRLQEQHSNIATLEQLCCIREDLNQLCEELSRLRDFHKSVQGHLYAALMNSSEYILKEGQKTLKESRLIDGMIDDIEEKEFELDNLKVLLSEQVKRNPPYVPHKQDPVDVALAEFINNRPPIPVIFRRVEAGSYKFGNRNVLIKLEAGRLRVRIGGGYTSIEDFIDVYGSQEADVSSPSNRSAFQAMGGMSPERGAKAFATTFGIVSSGSRSPTRK